MSEENITISKQQLLNMVQNGKMALTDYFNLSEAAQNKATPQSDIDKIKTYVCDSRGVFVSTTDTEINFKYLKEYICYALSKVDHLGELELHVTKRDQLKLLHYFWQTDFNYLGTRIILVEDARLETNLIDKFTIFGIHNDVPILYYENQ